MKNLLGLFWYVGMPCYGGLSRWKKLSADFCIELGYLGCCIRKRMEEGTCISEHQCFLFPYMVTAIIPKVTVPVVG